MLFLDDLQWADPGTLDVLARLLASGDGGPLVVLAWRDDEVGAEHPLSALISDGLEILEPGPLSVDDVAEMLADALSLEPRETRGLAERVHEKTAGNAFFVRSFIRSLHSEGLLTFDRERGRWTWSLEVIDAMAPTTNVADLLARQLQGFSLNARQVLGAAACLGKQLSLENLRDVLEKTDEDLGAGLADAVEAGLLTPMEGAWAEIEGLRGGDEGRLAGRLRFVHDEVYDAALRLMEAGERRRLHLRCGRAMLAAGEADPFAAADQFNQAGGLEDEERRVVAALNLMAGRRAHASAAFPAALHYLEAGVRLVRDADWGSGTSTAFQLHLAAASALLMCPEHEPAVDYATVAMFGATGVLERVAVQRVRIKHHIASYDFEGSIRLILEALGWVGVSLPAAAGPRHAAAAVARTLWGVRGWDRERLEALPECRDAEVVAAMQLLIEGGSASYYANTNLLPVLLCRMVDLSLKHGVTPESAVGFASHSFIQILARDDLEAAWMWSAVARALIERFGARRLAPRVELLALCFVEARREPRASLAPRWREVCLIALDVGDSEYAGLCAQNRSMFSLLGGVDLSELERRLDADLALCRELDQEQSINTLIVLRQLVAALRGESPDPSRLDGAHMDYDALILHMDQRGDQSGVAGVHLRQCLLMLLFGESEALLRQVELCDALIKHLPASPEVPPYLLHACLARLRSLRASGGRGREHRRRIHKHLKTLRRWSEKSPVNFAHKVRLIEAELADLDGDERAATRKYSEAIALARASGILHEEAICAEWAAAAALRTDNHRLAAALLREARTAWMSWGCDARLPVLVELESGLSQLYGSQGSVEDRATTLRSTIAGESLVDIASVVRASRAVSGEIQLEALLRTLMTIILENAGATAGVLVLEDEGGAAVAATAAVEGAGEGVTVAVEAEARRQLDARWPHAQAVITAVTRTREPVVISDGASDGRFFHTPASAPRSALCLPVLKGRTLVGVMYLENTLTRNAFTDDRHEVVGVLCSQAAVSIENARLYADLQQALEHQRAITRSFERFVPVQFLEQLGHESILDVELGDQVQREMTVLFMDIRGFTTVCEGLTPQETFALVNHLLARLGPIIRQHDGFIDKYIGDAVMALFPGNPADAVRAAIAMHQEVERLNVFRVERGDAAIRIGVGVHHGTLMLGTIGETERMDSTVISDAVNTCSRLEGLTKLYGAPILVSGSTLALCGDASFSQRYLGTVRPRGRASRVALYEVYDPLSAKVTSLRDSTRPGLEGAVRALEAGETDEARAGLEVVVAADPGDRAAQYLLEKLE